MKCPRLHGELEPICLNSDFSKPLKVHMCPDCRGVWIRPIECRASLGMACEKLIHQAKNALIALKCPGCGSNFKSIEYPLENGDSFGYHICSRCHSCFFDAVQFALIFYSQLKSERAFSGVLAHSPLDELGVVCCDCGAAVRNLDELYDAGIGFCCQKCHYNAPILSENKIQTAQLVTFHGMEIKIDHWQLSTKSRISVTPVEPCLIDAHLFSLTPIQRIFRFGQRKLALHGELGRHVDASEDIRQLTPWHLFLKQRGVTDCLMELTRLGMIDVAFKPHHMIFGLNAKRTGIDTKLRFELLTRRILLAYEHYVELTHRYKMPDDALE